MQVKQLPTAAGLVMEGPLPITPQVFGDERGFFFESWNQRRFDEVVGAATHFRQDNHSRCCLGVLRGLNYQLEPEPQGKLVRCTAGAIFDVAAELSAENHQQLWVPLRCSTRRVASGAKPASARCAGMIPSCRSAGSWIVLAAWSRWLADKDAAAEGLTEALAAGGVFA